MGWIRVSRSPWAPPPVPGPPPSRAVNRMDPHPPAPRRRTRSLILLSAGLALLILFAFLAVGVKQKTLFVETDALCRDVLHEHARASPEVAAVFAAITFLAWRPILWAEGAA